jgi:hypothetical protein
VKIDTVAPRGRERDARNNCAGQMVACAIVDRDRKIVRQHVKIVCPAHATLHMRLVVT